MKVCIAEKPSVAREIAQIIGAKEKKNGYFEGNGYQVTWTFGHLCTLKEPGDYHESLKSWNQNTLPIIPPRYDIKLITNNGVKEQFETIRSLFSKAEEIINCGDAGIEGELIQRWVLKHTRCEKPVKRLWISSLTEEAIRDGFQNLKDASDYDKLYYAGSSRAIGDWLLGINATRMYTMKYAPRGLVLSVGRVQTPTLAMIVSRYKEITSFDSSDFWELKTHYKKVKFNCSKGKISSEEEAAELLNSIKEELFTITSFEKKEGKESPTKLYDLTSLQVDCNKKFNLGAEETLKIAQNLYEKKLLTYPRVDTRFLPDDIYPKISGILQSLKAYQNLTQDLINKPIRKSKAVFNNKKVTDHHAIIPTNVTANGLGGDELKVYDLVVKRFISNFYPDCKVSKTAVIGKVNELEFKANGKQILDPGWRVVYGNDQIVEEETDKKGAPEEENQLLPDFVVNENGSHDPFTEKKQTNPPKHYTEATLLRAMETAGKQVDDEEVRDLMKENGIGRPSTRANIIQTLFRRQYIVKKRKSILPTPIGIQLIDSLKHDLLKSAELTGQWEKNIKNIENGSYEVKQFLEDMKHFVKEVVHQVKTDYTGTRIQLETEEDKKLEPAAKKPKVNLSDLSCPKCKKGTILKGKTAYGCSLYKKGCTFRINMEYFDKKITESQTIALISKNKTSTIKGFLIDGKKQEGHLFLNKTADIEFQKKEEKALTCPKCQQGTMIKGKSAYGCNRYQSGCKFIIPFIYQTKKLSESQIKSIIQKGRSPLIKGFKNTTGESFNGRIIINKDQILELVPT